MHSILIDPHLRWPLLLLAFSGLIGCDMEFDDSAIVHQVQASGMTRVTYMASNIRPNAEAKARLAREGKTVASWFKEREEKFCKDIDPEGMKVEACGYSPLPELLGRLISQAPSKPGQKDGLVVMKSQSRAKAAAFFCDGMEKGGCSFVVKPNTFVAKGTVKNMSAEAGCTYAIQSPYPILSTNADIVMHRYQTALWGCHEERLKGSKLRVELVAGK